MVRTRRLIPWLIATLVCLLPLTVAAVSLQQVELQRRAPSVALTLSFDARPKARVFTLSNPQRVVIDLKGVRGVPGLRLPAALGPVSQLRRGLLDGGGLRLVMEVAPGTGVPRHSYVVAAGGRGHQLIVELTNTAGATSVPAAANTATSAPPALAPNNPSAKLPIRAEHAPAETGREVIVAIDAGHGGQDPGASGKAGTREKDVVLAISKVLLAKINATPGMRAVLTRDGDYFVPHRQRIARARRARADIFVSVHADAVRDREVSGASVYVLSEKGATDEQARWLAETENAADLKGGVSLDDKDDTLATVLLDLSQSASIAESMRAAERVLTTLGRVSDVRKRRVQQAGFIVLKSPDIPSMLVETAYISNPADEKDLRSEAHRERIANAIRDGVRNYFLDHPPDGTQFALERRRGTSIAAL
jgi:N-acetylmuramoyl-L-alanine amidase